MLSGRMSHESFQGYLSTVGVCAPIIAGSSILKPFQLPYEDFCIAFGVSARHQLLSKSSIQLKLQFWIHRMAGAPQTVPQYHTLKRQFQPYTTYTVEYTLTGVFSFLLSATGTQTNDDSQYNDCHYHYKNSHSK